MLKNEEKQLNDDLSIFKIKYIHSIEISKLLEVRNNTLQINI